MAIEFCSRYGDASAPLPDPKTMCQGQCEGMGCVPIGLEEREEPWRSLWLEVEATEGPSENGYHFVTCPDCKGTGKKEQGDVPG